jgi:nitric oxide dioxygenase
MLLGSCCNTQQHVDIKTDSIPVQSYAPQKERGHSTLDPKTRGSAGMGLPSEMKPETIDTVAATAGAVGPKALEITKTFYHRMFQAHPSLLSFFNPAHNVPISTDQPTALANSIVAYASNIRDLSPLLVPNGAVAAIAHRHCALAVIPPQYVVVHENVMKSIGKVLGSAVTPEVAAAWSEAVLFLAKVLIDYEEDLYKKAERRSGGWSGLETFEVSAIEDVAEGIKSFSFKAPSGTALCGRPFEFSEGQYLSLKVDPEGDGLMAPRHYTVTSPPGAGYLQCTVKKIPGGKVSTYLHERLKVGDKVELTAPFGIFAPQAKEPTVLMSAGIGATPMLNFSKALGDNVKLAVHVDRTAESSPWRSHFLASGQPMLEKFTRQGGSGRTTPEALVRETIERAGVDNSFYVCGPPCWMERVTQELKRAGAKYVMTEIFGSQLGFGGCPFMGQKSSGQCPLASA